MELKRFFLLVDDVCVFEVINSLSLALLLLCRACCVYGYCFLVGSNLSEIFCVSNLDGFSSIKQWDDACIHNTRMAGSIDLSEHTFRFGSDSEIRMAEL